MNLNQIYSLARQVETSESRYNKYFYIAYNYNKNIRIFGIENLSELLYKTDKNEIPKNLIEFVSTEKNVFFIPNIIDNTIVEIICRSTTNKRFINVSCGYSTFYNIGCLPDERRFTDPVIICEGTADCEYIKHNINKNVVACLTDSISIMKLEVLRTLTNHVILSFDNDEAGKNAEKRESYKLKRFGFFVEYLHPDPWYKDFGDMILFV